jgi:hypothetical protein
MQQLKQYIKTKFQKHPVKLFTYQQDLQECIDEGESQEFCHSYICDSNFHGYSECENENPPSDDTLQYILLFVIIGLVCYGGYKYLKK